MRKCLLLLLELDELISLGELNVPFGFELGGVLPRVEITGGSCIILMVTYKTTVVLSVVKYFTRQKIVILVVCIKTTEKQPWLNLL